MNILVSGKKFFFGEEGVNHQLIIDALESVGYSNVDRIKLCNDELSRLTSEIESAIDAGLTKIVIGDFRLTDVLYKGDSSNIIEW